MDRRKLRSVGSSDSGPLEFTVHARLPTAGRPCSLQSSGIGSVRTNSIGVADTIGIQSGLYSVSKTTC
ncbi:hypothetical protein ACFYO7_08370 [Nocardia salmonicida]|uniref:hypothetical protein n=1 Tax=Nocardia salmonicida TaxID=53431 RepID=UPI00367AD817